MKYLRAISVSTVLALVSVGVAQGADKQDGYTYQLPDFRPRWAPNSLMDIRYDTAHSNDRLASCDDWTALDTMPAGFSVLSFTLLSPNFGEADLRLRRNNTPDGIEMYQTIWQVDPDGVCSAVETDTPVAVIPHGTDQAGRWLPLAKFALYNVADDGSLGDQVACQIKRWCCLGSQQQCPTRGTCPRLPTRDDNLEAGAMDGYPFHWTDQFVPVEGLPSGDYWFEDEINPGGIMWESDYTNNSMFFKIHIDQDARTVQILEPPDGSFSQCPG